MNIEEFIKAKRQMEYEIQMAIAAATFKFWGETGYTPHSINVRMYEKTTLGSKTRQFIVGEVRSEVGIE